MNRHLHLLLAASFGAMSIGAAAAVHDWTATRIGPFDTDILAAVDMNNAGQVAVSNFSEEGQRTFLYTPGSSGGLVDLGSFGGSRSAPRALNASGEVVGFSLTAGGVQQAFVYRDGRMQRLGLPGETAGQANDINDRGQIVAGFLGAGTTSSGAIFHPAGPPTVLSIPGGSVTPSGINNRGQVFGSWSRPTDTRNSSFFYDNGRMVDIGTLGGNTNASDMNKSGQIVGGSEVLSGISRPFLYSDGKITQIGIGTTADVGVARDINDRGQVVGDNSPRPFASEAFLYSDGQAHEFGDLGGGFTFPWHLNELGQVVGFSSLPGAAPADAHAFFYSDDDGRTTDLTRWLMKSFPDVAFVESAREIQLNDLGQIALAADLTNGQQAIFVLTPIPEPSTYALMLSGLGVLAWMARRQRSRSIGI